MIEFGLFLNVNDDDNKDKFMKREAEGVVTRRNLEKKEKTEERGSNESIDEKVKREKQRFGTGKRLLAI